MRLGDQRACLDRSKIRDMSTRIAFTVKGDGPRVVLVGGGATDRSENAPLATALAARGFTAVNYDRRGRGESADGAPYAVAREIEDLAGLAPRFVVGVSSGGALALEAAVAGVAIERLAGLNEVPYNVDPGGRRAGRVWTSRSWSAARRPSR